MIEIVQNLCPADRYPVKCPFVRTPTRLVIHNTANDAPAENEISYMLRRPEEVSFHFAVDDRRAVQGLPLDRNAWASGDGHGPGNLEGIHIEICYSLSGGPRFDAAEQNAAKLAAQLLRQFGWGLDKVTKHQDYDGKTCPHRTLERGWERFLAMIQGEMAEEAPEENRLRALARQEIQAVLGEMALAPPAAWAQGALERCRAEGLLVGGETGDLQPGRFVTRQELAVVLVRLLERWEP